MTRLEEAVARLSAAVTAAERQADLEVRTSEVQTGDLFGEDRAALMARIEQLEVQAEEDAALRAEAAAAVKAALDDLRAVSEHSSGGGHA
ncbi:MAG: hypothetical protein AAF416_06420 [Pseudomonadota bacterium]